LAVHVCLLDSNVDNDPPHIREPVVVGVGRDDTIPPGGFFRMFDFRLWQELITRGVETAGIVVIAAGGIIASGYFAVSWWTQSLNTAYLGFRRDFGRAILLGLELLVAADIINTVAVDPTLRSVGVLAGVVLIRTFLSFSLQVEISGRWPWQHDDTKRLEADHI